MGLNPAAAEFYPLDQSPPDLVPAPARPASPAGPALPRTAIRDRGRPEVCGMIRYITAWGSIWVRAGEA